MIRKKILSFFFFFMFLVISNIFILNVSAIGSVSNPTKDSWVFGYTGNVNTNYGSDGVLNLGYNVNYRYLYIDWNITDLVTDYGLGNIPEKVYIRLFAYFFIISPNQDLEVNVYRVLSDWNETDITYNNQPTLGSICSSVTVDGSEPTIHQYYYIDITDDFLDVLDSGGSGFYGYCLKTPYSSVEQFMYVYSKETTSSYNSIYYGLETTVSDVPDYSDELTYWVIIAIVLLMPSITIAGISAQISPSMGIIGFLGGLTIMGAISLNVGLINIWFMFVIIVVDILIILGLIKNGGM